MGILSFLIFFPALIGVLLLVWPNDRLNQVRSLATVASAIQFIASLWLWFDFVPGNGFQFTESVDWITRYGIGYRVGVDGISLLLVLLTTLLTIISVVSSYSSIQAGLKGYYASLLFLETGVIGAFVATDVFLFYVFWEAMLIPMYFLIGIWGGERRIYATVKFVLYTMAGSLLMLVAIIWTYQYSGGATGGTFNLFDWYGLTIPTAAQPWLFAAFALAFAIKVPMFPFHTWLPDAHVQAPAAGSVMLAGELLKLGTYGFLRFAVPLFPLGFEYFADTLWILAVIGIVYGAIMTLIQDDIKSLVAYSSVSHLGFVILGMMALNIVGATGSLLQQVNHGISTGALFLLVGMIYERRHTRKIADYGGIFAVVPVFSIAFLIVALSSIGLPGTNGFVGEFLILLGAFSTRPWLAGISALAIILAAGYMLWLVRRVFFGPIVHTVNETIRDLSKRELATLIPLLILIIWIGVYPKPFLDRIGPDLQTWLAKARSQQMIQTVPQNEPAPAAVRKATPPRPDSTIVPPPQDEAPSRDGVAMVGGFE
ncbi:MAG: NADH-quinone oxidoreductase subunit M [candidate division Zixibacteria bacterium]|nr:NADH-quinone oxidoreductase subunit M [candidate division Zixibacteria bacterium]